MKKTKGPARSGNFKVIGSVMRHAQGGASLSRSRFLELRTGTEGRAELSPYFFGQIGRAPFARACAILPALLRDFDPGLEMGRSQPNVSVHSAGRTRTWNAPTANDTGSRANVCNLCAPAGSIRLRILCTEI